MENLDFFVARRIIKPDGLAARAKSKFHLDEKFFLNENQSALSPQYHKVVMLMI